MEYNEDKSSLGHPAFLKQIYSVRRWSVVGTKNCVILIKRYLMGGWEECLIYSIHFFRNPRFDYRFGGYRYFKPAIEMGHRINA
jgi:hypothetical protein